MNRSMRSNGSNRQREHDDDESQRDLLEQENSQVADVNERRRSSCCTKCSFYEEFDRSFQYLLCL